MESYWLLSSFNCMYVYRILEENTSTGGSGRKFFLFHYPLIHTHIQGNKGAKLATENFKTSMDTVLRGGGQPLLCSTAEKFIIVRMMLCITHRNLDLACCITFVLHQPLSLYIFPCNCHSSLAFHRLSIALKYFLIVGFRCHIGDEDYGFLAPCSETYVMSQASSPTAGQPTPAPAMAAALTRTARCPSQFRLSPEPSTGCMST